MENFWQKQDAKKPLFSDVLWSKPERKSAAGRVAIIGGSAQGFAAVAHAYEISRKVGAGAVRVILPAAIKNKIPPTLDAIFAPSNRSGGFSRDALADFRAAADFADVLLLVGDFSKNSETAAVLENFLSQIREQNTQNAANAAPKIIVCRDAVDLLLGDTKNLLTMENLSFVVSLNQLQKITRGVFYPRVVTFSQGPRQIAETLHKFTISFSAGILLWYRDNLFAAQNGRVASQDFAAPLRVWNGEIAARVATWWNFSPDFVAASACAWAEM